MAELEEALYAKILELSKQGDRKCEEHAYELAIKCYRKALAIIPNPISDWHASTWLMVALGDALLLSKDFPGAKRTLEEAMHCPDAVGNPYIHLRLGQACLEIGDEVRAADELARAYMGGGEEIFDGQPEKYLRFIKTRLIT